MRRFRNSLVFKGKRILVADECDTLRNLVAVIFGFAGAEAIEVNNGEECIAMARSARPDMIFMDADIHRINGIDVCRTLKNSGETLSIPILLTSSDHTMLKSAGSGPLFAEGYLAKPFNSLQLLEKAVCVLSL